MALCIKSDTTVRLVDRLARLCGVSKQDAMALAVMAELKRAAKARPLPERFAELRAAHTRPPATGAAIDKAFFDDLSGMPFRSSSMPPL